MEYKVKSCAECEKKCENCHFRKEFLQNQIEQPKCSIVQPHEKDYIPDGKITNFLLVVLILVLIVVGFIYYQNEIVGNRTILRDTKVRINEDSSISLEDVLNSLNAIMGQ